ncbi:MAG: HD domain-containing protein [Patescibacteria group bacterium]
MKVLLPDFVNEIIENFAKNNFEIYIVGGAVRDILMGKMVDDWDFTTNATPEQILKIFPDAFYDNKFGTVGISHESSVNPYEITTFRTETNYSDHRRPEKVTWGKSLKEDLSRRDFTINAMALRRMTPQGKPSECELIDPYDGQKDLEAKIIKAVGNPNERFNEDSLRMMRAIRIASEIGFTIEEKTFAAIKSNATLINQISKERIKEELFKILGSFYPYDGMIIFRSTGLLAEIIPELEKTFGVEQKSPGRHHIYDVGTHLLLSLKYCKSTDPVTRFATLVHDIGKPQTFKKLESGTITFYNHEVVGTRITRNIAERLRFSKKETEKLLTLVRRHQFTVNENQTDSAIRRFVRKVGLENVEDMLALRVADRLGGGARETSWRLEEFKKRLIEVQKEPFSIKDLKINGNDIMKILQLQPGPKVGEILAKLFNEVVEKKIENDRDILLQHLKEFSKRLS